MKKIFLTCAVMMCIFAVEAQKKTAKKTNYQKKEATAKAEFNKKEKERQEAIEAEAELLRVQRLRGW